MLLNQQIKRFNHERGKGAKEAVGGKRESEALVATKDYEMRLMWERKKIFIHLLYDNKKECEDITYIDTLHKRKKQIG